MTGLRAHDSTAGLRDRVAIVTGGTSGLGRAIAAALRDEGATVVIGARDRDRGDKAAAALGADFVQADVARADDCGRLIGRAVELHGAVHVLVNNAGAFGMSPATGFSEDQWHAVVDTKFKGTFFCTIAAIPHMLSAGWGRVINISASAKPYAAGGVYSGANGAIGYLTRAWALEHAGSGITFNEIRPGFCETEATALVQQNSEFFASILATIPEGRAGTPQEIASVAAYLASDAARYIQGTEIVIDGGQALGWTSSRPAAGDRPSASI